MIMEQFLKEGTILKGNKNTYSILGILGQGSFGITYKAKLLSGEEEIVAIKEYFPKQFCTRMGNDLTCLPQNQENFDYFKEKFKKEIERILQVPHKNVVRTYESFDANKTAYYVMEYAPGRSLETFKEEMPEKEAIDYIVAVAGAVSVLHQRKINHLDIKPENIVLRQNGEPVLIDFGIARGFDQSGQHQTSINDKDLSTLGYAPYEQYSEESEGIKTFSAQADIYALGATLYRLLTGERPVGPFMLNKGNYKDLVFSNMVSVKTQNAIKYAMQFLPERRPKNIAEFLAVLDPNKPQCVVPDYVLGIQDFSPFDDGGTRIGRVPQEPVPVASGVKQPIVNQQGTAGTAPSVVAPPKKSNTSTIVIIALIVFVGFLGYKYIGSDKKDVVTSPVDSTATIGSSNATPVENHKLSSTSGNTSKTKKDAEVSSKAATVPSTIASSTTAVVTPAQAPSATVATSQPAVVTELSADELVSKGLSASKKFQYESAADYYAKAVNKGSVTAMYYLGDLYYNGNGVSKSFPTAKKYFTQAAGSGLVDAQYMLGMMFRNGQGGDKDISQAKVWLQKAANAGHAQAERMLNNL